MVGCTNNIKNFYISKTDRSIREITEKQLEYIKILSSYESTKLEDETDIENLLDALGKDDVSDLSLKEASDLIQLLLKRLIEYVLPCGLKADLHKSDVNKYGLFGSFDACLHECPDEKIDGDVNSCKTWLNSNES